LVEVDVNEWTAEKLGKGDPDIEKEGVSVTAEPVPHSVTVGWPLLLAKGPTLKVPPAPSGEPEDESETRALADAETERVTNDD